MFSLIKNRILLTILFIFLSVIVSQGQHKKPLNNDRPKIGLVLSGGGAKGFAHVGVLKVLEREGIPIDYIAGTSMGALIGGFYALGYSASDIEKVVLDQKWEDVLSDKVSRKYIPLYLKLGYERYVLSFPIKPKGIQLPVGIVKGQNVMNLFENLSQKYHGELDYSKFPIPFLCIAGDIETGEAVVLDKGFLPEAMRASMAIPTIFSPIDVNGRLLVDGGVVNNFPVEEVLKMGADIVIGIDVQSGLKAREDLSSINDIISQLVSLMSIEKFNKSKNFVDIYIRPNLDDFAVSSFLDADTLIALGESAANKFIPVLRSLKKQYKLEPNDIEAYEIPTIKDSLFIKDIYIHGLNKVSKSLVRGKMGILPYSAITSADIKIGIDRVYGSQYFDLVHYRLIGDDAKDLHIYVNERVTDRFNVGIAYNSDNNAALLLNTTFRNKIRNGSTLAFDLRLSEKPRFTATYNIDNGLRPGLQIQADFDDEEIFAYEDGDKIKSLDFRRFKFDVNTHLIYNESYSLGFGAKLERFQIESNLYSPGKIVDLSDNFISYYSFISLDTHEKAYFPRKGMSLYAEYKLVTHDGWSFNGNRKPVSFLMLRFAKAISVSKRLTLTPMFFGQTMWGSSITPEFLTYVGGYDSVRDFSNYIPFVGLRRFEHVTRNAYVFRTDISFEIFRKNYIIIRPNIMRSMESIDSFFTQGKWITGIGLTYAYESLIGPMEVSLMYSDQNKKLNAYLSLGYRF